jgi:endogenous inhibitor of DNA gyrase (YacG/DUF329 family)
MAGKPKPIGNDGAVYKCPICKAVLPHAAVPTFPFCSERCRLRDLGNWVDGKYVFHRPIDLTDQIENMPRREGGD